MSFLSKFRHLTHKSAPEIPPEDQKLLDALSDLQLEIDSLRSLFNMTDDADMIEYYAHEYKALGARHSYLIKQARARGVTYQPRLKETAMR